MLITTTVVERENEFF